MDPLRRARVVPDGMTAGMCSYYVRVATSRNALVVLREAPRAVCGLTIAGGYAPPFRPLKPRMRTPHRRVKRFAGDFRLGGLRLAQQEKWRPRCAIASAPVLVGGLPRSTSSTRGLIPRAAPRRSHSLVLDFSESPRSDDPGRPVVNRLHLALQPSLLGCF